MKHLQIPLATSHIQGKALKVWDIATRVAHWSVALLFGVSWLTAEYGWISWHRISGYAMLCLVLFRLYWGIWGSDTARFARFVRGPRAVRAYLSQMLRRSRPKGAIGHNPLGAWSVVLMLILLTLQTGSGLFAVDEYGIEGGRLAEHLGFEAARRAAAIHGALFDILLIVVAVHVSAVTAYLVVGRENLIAPMITGRKPSGEGEPAPLAMAPLGRAAAAVAVIVTAVLALAFYG